MAMEGDYGTVGANLNDQLKKVYVSNERLISLVEDLLNLSRIEDGRMKYDWTTEDLGEIVGSVVEELAEPAKRKNLPVIWRAPKEKLLAQVDRNKIRNVIFNLIDNALKYTEEGQITVHLKQEKKSIVVSVTDTGRGITADQLTKLFSKFSRVESDSSKRTVSVAGFGLGLYVAKLIVKDHKGDAWAESKGLGKGSTFFMRVPLASTLKKNK